MTSTVTYLGDLRTSCIHLSSGTSIITDAPTDNFGNGEAFSPTDLVATSLASCMLTIIGIYCQNHEIEFHSGYVEVEKIMASSPRRIEKIRLNIDLNANNWDEETRKKVITAGKACPVAKTLEGNVEMEFNFI
jgi:putative redox protein